MTEKATPSRRSFIAAGAVGAAASTFPKPAIASGKQEWKMVMTWQETLPGLGTGAVRLAKRITSLTEGRITIKPFGGGELVPPLGVFDAVSKGTAECGHSAPYYWLNKSKASAFFCNVPGGLTAQENNAWLYFGGGQKLWDKLYAPFGVKAMPAGNTGAQMGGWFKREINSVKDLDGLKMRLPGLAGEALNLLGGSAQTIPPQELFTSMQSGVIDALEWVGAWNDLALGFHKVADYYYGPGFHEGGPTLEFMVNKEKWDALPKDLKRIIKAACATENDVMLAEYTLNNIRAFDTLKSKHNVDARALPDDVLKALFEAAQTVVSDVAKVGKIEKEIAESYLEFRRQAMQMAPLAEFGYMRGRALK